MKDRVFWRIFRSVFLSFFALWLLLVGVLTFQNLDAKQDQVEHAMGSYEESTLKNCQLVLEGTAEEWEKPAILTNRMTSYDTAGAMGVFRLYDQEGTELARTPLTWGSFCLPGTGVYDHYLCFDTVLSEEEHVALAKRIRANPIYTHFYGTEGGLYEASDNERVGLRGEVIGVQEGNVVYPQKLVYYYEEGPVVLLDTDSSFFQDKALTTFPFDAAQVSSPLVWSKDSPEQALTLFRAAEGRIDSLLDGRKPGTDWTGGGGGGQGYARCGPSADQPELISAYGVAYHTWRLGSSGLEFTYGATFLFLLLLALRVSKRQADTLRRERSLTRAAAHELKTPAAVVRSYAEALREDIAPEKREEYLSVLMDEADRMGGLVCDLLELSRMEGEEKRLLQEDVDLTALVAGAAQRLGRSAEEQSIRVVLDLEPVRIAGDRMRLEQVVDNLLSNALRHTPPGGAIRLTLVRWDRIVRLAVENDGEPIPPEDLGQLFETFWRGEKERARAGGSGLGLALVREAVRLHHGFCGAENIPGGVRFWVELPGGE